MAAFTGTGCAAIKAIQAIKGRHVPSRTRHDSSIGRITSSMAICAREPLWIVWRGLVIVGRGPLQSDIKALRLVHIQPYWPFRAPHGQTRFSQSGTGLSRFTIWPACCFRAAERTRCGVGRARFPLAASAERMATIYREKLIFELN